MNDENCQLARTVNYNSKLIEIRKKDKSEREAGCITVLDCAPARKFEISYSMGVQGTCTHVR